MEPKINVCLYSIFMSSWSFVPAPGLRYTCLVGALVGILLAAYMETSDRFDEKSKQSRPFWAARAGRPGGKGGQRHG